MLRIEIIQALQERIRDTELIDGSRLSASLRAATKSRRVPAVWCAPIFDYFLAERNRAVDRGNNTPGL
jgi:hypothetical protein